MAKMDKGNVSKNAKTNRKAIASYYKGQKVRPVKVVMNPLGAKTIVGGILRKISSRPMLAVQLESGDYLMENGSIVFWDDIAHLIVRK